MPERITLLPPRGKGSDPITVYAADAPRLVEAGWREPRAVEAASQVPAEAESSTTSASRRSRKEG